MVVEITVTDERHSGKVGVPSDFDSVRTASLTFTDKQFERVIKTQQARYFEFLIKKLIQEVGVGK